MQEKISCYLSSLHNKVRSNDPYHMDFFMFNFVYKFSKVKLRPSSGRQLGLRPHSQQNTRLVFLSDFFKLHTMIIQWLF